MEVLKDADDSQSFIGEPINIAARLSRSQDNQGILYESSYAQFVDSLPIVKKQDPIHPKFGNKIQIKGKQHDSSFSCIAGDLPDLPLSEFYTENLQLFFNSLPQEEKPITIPGIVIAYDLPKFSQGNRTQLSKRFRSVIYSIKRLKIENPHIFSIDKNSFFFSPGGDGGILVLQTKQGVSPKDYPKLAPELFERLELESDDKQENIQVKSRIGIHCGTIDLYKNDRGIFRPTGPTCFIVDEIISDEVAKQKEAIIITEKIKTCYFSDKTEKIQEEYEELPPLEKGVAKDIQRYRMRQKGKRYPSFVSFRFFLLIKSFKRLICQYSSILLIILALLGFLLI